MKFTVNDVLTIGTLYGANLEGANLEIREEIGGKIFSFFGWTCNIGPDDIHPAFSNSDSSRILTLSVQRAVSVRGGTFFSPSGHQATGGVSEEMQAPVLIDKKEPF